METLHRIHTVRERVAAWRGEGAGVALVPTMGNLHDGHLSLVRLALQRAGHVVVSIFVNPLQFGPSEDFNTYPRTAEHDLQLLAKEGVDLVFAPTALEMYPVGVERTTVVDSPEFSGVLEGHFRPGHFRGVATVVTKLFNIVMPHVAVFGEKDFQQLVVIRRLVRDLCLPIEIVGGAIVRDHDGLAMSSRNQYLSPAERDQAPQLHRALHAARNRILGGDRRWDDIEADGMSVLSRAGFEPDYFAVRGSQDLLPPRECEEEELVLLAAARLGETRLIDNVKVRLA